MKRLSSILLSLCLIISILVLPTTVEATESSVIEKAISWAIATANDNSHGYSQKNRWGNPDYDCSSFVISAFRNAGINTGATNTRDMRKLFTKNGFEWISWSKIGGLYNLKRGDILLNEAQHTELYLGNSQIIGAHRNYGYSQSGDQTGQEISIQGYYYHPWDGVLRYKGVNPIPDDCNCSDSYAGNYIINTNRQPLTLRSGHGTSFSAITTIPKGSTVYVSKANGVWAHVKWNNYTGYCSMQYLSKVKTVNPPSGYNIEISNNNFYDNEISTVTITPCDSNITNYKLHFIAPDGRVANPDLGSKNYYKFACPGVYGTWKVYAEITNDGGTFCGSTSNGCLSFNVKKVNWGNCVNLGSDFYASIGNATSSNVLTHASLSDYTNVYMSKNTYSDNQIFRFVRQNDGSYVIKSRKESGYCLDVYYNKYVSGTNVGVYPENGSNAQKWMIYSAGNGYYYFRPIEHNSSMLDVEGGSPNDGTNVQIYTYNGTNAQKFSINKISTASLLLDKSSLNLDLASNSTATVNVTASGLLPSNYKFSVNRDTSIFNTKWGSWDGNTAPISITAKKIGNYTIDFNLNDVTNNDNIIASKTISVVVKCSHKYTKKVVASTCEKMGYTLYTCSLCGNSYKDSFTNVKNHSFGLWTTTKNATCKVTGVKTRVCSFCNITETLTIAKTDHKYITNIVAPTTTSKGYTLHKCSICGDSYKNNYTEPITNSKNESTTPTKIALNKSSITLKVGESYTLTKTVTPTNAKTSYTWSSSNTNVASINSSGKITAKKVGTTTITVKTANGKKATCKVSVVVAPTSIVLNKTNISLGSGEKYTLTQTITPANASTNYTWSSSNTNIASVTSSGVITAKKSGTATITVKTTNGKKASCKVTVKYAPSKISLNKTKITLGVGEIFDFNSSMSSDSASYNVKYTSSNTSVATVNASGGIMTAKKAGTAVITATTYNGKKATCVVTVKNAPSKISLNKTKITLKVGQTFDLNSSLASGTASYSVKYTSNNTSVATVKASGGIVTAKKKGIATITATTYNGKTATCKVTVIK